MPPTPPIGTLAPPLRGRLLVLLCSYRGGIGNPPPFSVYARAPYLGRLAQIADRLTLLAFRGFVAANRDFFANIRPFEYQIGLVEEALAGALTSDVRIRIDRKLADNPVVSRVTELGPVEVKEADALAADPDAAEMILVVYPDALGLGWSPLERRLPADRTYILNGRRRIFALDKRTRRALRWRRLLACTRIPEIAAGLAIIPVAAGLAIWDSLRGRS